MARNVVSVLSLGIVWSCMMLSHARAQESFGRIRIGAAFSDEDFPALEDGRRTNLRAFRGKPTVLIVFASW